MGRFAILVDGGYLLAAAGTLLFHEVFDVWVQNAAAGEELREIPLPGITGKLDADFFAGRWARATDRQRDLLGVVAQLETSATEFTVQEVAVPLLDGFIRRQLAGG